MVRWHDVPVAHGRMRVCEEEAAGEPCDVRMRDSSIASETRSHAREPELICVAWENNQIAYVGK